MFDFILLWLITAMASMLIMFIVLQLDHKYIDGDLRELIEEKWIVILILLAIPIINIIFSIIVCIVFIVLLIAVKMDEYGVDGEMIIKKIFFIKDGK